jgi:DNA-directed RNA polymerase subunit RPC12/RpoP
MNLYTCQSCGGELIADENTGATSCPYCGNPVILKSRFEGDLRPDYVIPFKLDKKAAKEAMAKHLKGKPLLPKIFKDENHIDEIKGLYVPFWLFNCDTYSKYTFRGTKLRHWSDSKYDYTETSYYNIYREGNLDFKNVPVDGSEKMPDDLMESVEPFDYSQMVDFETAYLSGYLADKYDVDQESSIGRANDRIKVSTEEAFINTAPGYSSITTSSSNVGFYKNSSQYALLPVWVLNTSWKEQKFIFAMNGQTGKFVGNLPTDWKLFWKWFFGVFAASAIVITLIAIAILSL